MRCLHNDNIGQCVYCLNDKLADVTTHRDVAASRITALEDNWDQREKALVKTQMFFKAERDQALAENAKLREALQKIAADAESMSPKWSERIAKLALLSPTGTHEKPPEETL